jgi:hypothetical protein
MQVVLSKNSGFPSSLANPVGCGVRQFKSVFQYLGLIFVRHQFYLGNQFHVSSIDIPFRFVKPKKEVHHSSAT